MKTMILAAVAAFGFAASSQAEISADNLAAMGLGGATIVSDVEASEVRGLGYMSGRGFAIAGGGSVAGVSKAHGGAGSVNFYLAAGRNAAGGDNVSEAGFSSTRTKVTNVKGHRRVTRTTKTLSVFAGGASNSYSF